MKKFWKILKIIRVHSVDNLIIGISKLKIKEKLIYTDNEIYNTYYNGGNTKKKIKDKNLDTK